MKPLTTIKQIAEKPQLKGLSGFEFNWHLQSADDTVTFGAFVKDEIVGLVEFERAPQLLYNYMYIIEVAQSYRGTTVAGELLAFIGLDAFKQGFDGFVVFESKAAVYEYYILKYGAKPARGMRLFFDSEATKKLIQNYLGEVF